MIRQIYKLTQPKQIEICHAETEFSENEVLVHPEYMAICAADRRYYNFERPIEIMKKKVPLSLIHEISGSIYYDVRSEYNPGDTVVIIPSVPVMTEAGDNDDNIKENYRRDTMFCSSSCDGFMQSVVPVKRDRIIKVSPENLRVAVLCELLSVAVNALQNIIGDGNTVFGVWGDGSVGFVTALALKYKFPKSKILIWGHSEQKLLYFSFAEIVRDGSQLRECVDYAFECVGGNAVGDIAEEMITMIKPQGVINLLGVSEYKQNINTRMILEKGLTVKGHSRSSRDDFLEAVNIIEKNRWIRDSLLSIISEEITVISCEDIHKAFERDPYNDFKTIIKWRI